MPGQWFCGVISPCWGRDNDLARLNLACSWPKAKRFKGSVPRDAAIKEMRA